MARLPANGHAEGTYGPGWCGNCALNHHYWEFVTCSEFTYRGTQLLDERIRKKLTGDEKAAARASRPGRVWAALKQAWWELWH